MALIATAILAATYMLAVRTYLGQYLENSALLGAQQANVAEVDGALASLETISVTSLAVMCVVLVVIGLARHSWRIALASVATLATSVLAAEALKRYLLVRPNLADIYEDNAHNSFPSGHTTIAMAILVTLLIAAAYRWRGLLAFVAMGWAVSVGAATVTARWHRLSDTLGADMLVLAIGALAALWLTRAGCIREERGKPRPLRVIFVVVFAVTAVAALAVGGILVSATLSRWGVLESLSAGQALTAHLDPQFNQNMFFAAQSLAYAFSILSALWFWATLHRLEFARSQRFRR